MWCPRCGLEFRPGFTRCADCDVDLVGADPTELTSTVSRLSFGSSAVQVFDFGAKTVRDGAGLLLGSCALERVDVHGRRRKCYVCRDHAGGIAWMVRSTFFGVNRVLGGNGHEIGAIRAGRLDVDGQPFAQLLGTGKVSGKPEYVIRDVRDGKELARITNASEGSFRQKIRVRLSSSLTGLRRQVVAATACTLEASATLGE